MIASCTSSWNSATCAEPRVELPLDAQLGGEHVVRLEVRIGRRERRARRHELVELRRRREAVRLRRPTP